MAYSIEDYLDDIQDHEPEDEDTAGYVFPYDDGRFSEES